MSTRLQHLWLALTTLPRLTFNRPLRELWREMRAFARALPQQFRPPLPDALDHLTPAQINLDLGEDRIRKLADTAAVLDRQSPFGLCLRRSLVRYHYLRRAGIPIDLRFGARFVDGKPDREISGHAWVTLQGEAYHEPDENWRGFTVMFSHPATSERVDIPR